MQLFMFLPSNNSCIYNSKRSGSLHQDPLPTVDNTIFNLPCTLYFLLFRQSMISTPT